MMRRGNLLANLRKGRALWSVATLYLLLLPVLLGILPKPAATAEFEFLRALATAEICAMPGSDQKPGQPMQHQPDCILCSTACPFNASPAAAPPPDETTVPSLFRQTLALASVPDFALPASRRFISDIQARGPPARA